MFGFAGASLPSIYPGENIRLIFIWYGCLDSSSFMYKSMPERECKNSFFIPRR